VGLVGARVQAMLEMGWKAANEGRTGRALNRAYDIWNEGDEAAYPELLELLDRIKPDLGRGDLRPYNELYPQVARVVGSTTSPRPDSIGAATGPSRSADAASSATVASTGALAPPTSATWVSRLVPVFVIAAILSIIGGIVVGISASDLITPDLKLQMQQGGISRSQLENAGIHTRDNGLLVAWIIGGLLTAALWAAAAVVLTLLAEIAHNTRRS
jgi:hypothetical protein